MYMYIYIVYTYTYTYTYRYTYSSSNPLPQKKQRKTIHQWPYRNTKENLIYIHIFSSNHMSQGYINMYVLHTYYYMD